MKSCDHELHETHETGFVCRVPFVVHSRDGYAEENGPCD
jgi:hypothetical protein